MKELTFVGAGAVLAPVINRLAGLGVRVLSRRELPPGVQRIGWEELGQGRGLIVCGISVSEEQLLAAAGHSLRSLVARANAQLLAGRNWPTDRPLLVLTNPSELMAHRLWQQTGNSQIYAFGLSVDRERLNEMLAICGHPPLELGQVGGFHAVGPLISRCLDVDWSHLHGRRSAYSFTDCQLTGGAKDLRTALQAWTLTEFNGFKPPHQRAASMLYKALQEYQEGRPVEVGGLDQGMFVGGLLTGREFQALDWVHHHPEWPQLQRQYIDRITP